MEVVSILYVEDEVLLQGEIEAALQEAGFTVATATLGKQALAMLDAPEANYRALVTDIHLGPGQITGWDVARHARELHPELPVVYVTGHGADEWAAQGVPNSALVTKPFAPAQVVTAVSQLINQATSAPPAPD